MSRLADYEVRLATAEDAGRLPDIERSAGKLFKQSPGLEWVAGDDVMSEEEHAALIAQGSTWVAEADQLVGFVACERVDSALHVWELAVHQDAQGHGVGRALMQAAIGHATDVGLSDLTLTTFRDVPWNAPFYASLGFTELAEDELTEHLARELAHEGELGLPVERRCAMALTINR